MAIPDAIKNIETSSEVDPREAAQKAWQSLFIFRFRSRQLHGNDSKRFIADAFIKSRAHFLILPGPQTARPEKHRASSALVESLFKRFLPWGARYEMPFVEKRTHPLLIYESRRDGFD
jgi:hypothetical protein